MKTIVSVLLCLVVASASLAGEFRFSPRPNKAGQIQWRSWSTETLAEARKKDRLILLSLSAVWCHWCHVMDEKPFGVTSLTLTYCLPQHAILRHMARPLRIQYNDAVYHVTCRGNDKRDIFRDDTDRDRFLRQFNLHRSLSSHLKFFQNSFTLIATILVMCAL